MQRANKTLLVQLLLTTGLCVTASCLFAADNMTVDNVIADKAVTEKVALDSVVDSPVVLSVAETNRAVDSASSTILVEKAPAKAKEDMTLLERLQPFFASDDPWVVYAAQKAKAWINYANNEASERSLTPARKEALAEATAITEKLEKSEPISATTTVLSVSKVMRRDLWATAELLKQHPGFDCSATEVAQAEVMLVWAAAEHCELGWHHSREPFAAAERLIDQATYQAFNCRADLPNVLPKVDYPSMESLNGTKEGCHGVVGQWPIVAKPEAVVVEPAVLEPVVAPVVADVVIPNAIHFALDKATLSAASINVLNDIIDALKLNPTYSVTLYGYTDLRASAAYNLALSKRRAHAIEAYLVAHGIAASRIAIVAEGKKSVIDDNNAVLGHALSRRVELVYASADGKEVKSLQQRADVQLEH